MRIASLLPSATEILFAIGAGRDVAGVTHECDYPPAVMALPPLTSSAIGHEGRTCADIDRHIRAARPRVACLEWTSPAMAGGHWVPELVRLAGGDDPLGQVGGPSRAVGCDEIAAAAPDIVVFMPCGFHLARTREVTAEVTEHPSFGRLPAARAGRVAAVDGSSYFSRPGPRIVGGLEILAAIIRAEPGGPLPAGAAWVPLAQCSGPRPGALGTGDLPGARRRAEPAGG